MNRDLNQEALERILSKEEEIIPSSGFVASVMDAVRQEASAPAPIPFPWKWALPGLVVCVGLIVFCLVRFIAGGAQVGSSVAAGFSFERFLEMIPHRSVDAPIALGIEWGALALLLSLFSVWLSMRISVRGE